MKLQLVFFCVLGMLAQAAIAQQTQEFPAPAASGSNLTSYSPFAAPQSATSWRRVANQEMRDAVNSYKEAGDEQEKSKAAGQMRGVLEGQYDNLIKDYETHLDAMEKKIAKMREQIQKRRSARDEMVDLRLKMMIKEAEGLGWPDDRPTGFFNRNPFSGARSIGNGPSVGGAGMGRAGVSR